MNRRARVPRANKNGSEREKEKDANSEPNTHGVILMYRIWKGLEHGGDHFGCNINENQ